MSKTKTWLMDMEEQYYDIAEKCIGECECFDEFADKMNKHTNLMIGLYDMMEIEDIQREMWQEKWSEYA